MTAPIQDASSSVTSKGALARCSSGMAGDVHASTVPPAKAASVAAGSANQGYIVAVMMKGAGCGGLGPRPTVVAEGLPALAARY